jgi:hypothetical protein
MLKRKLVDLAIGVLAVALAGILGWVAMSGR